MITLTFVSPDGARQEVQAQVGHSVMEVARDNGIEGIVAECNGSLACATCHCYFNNGTDYGIGAPGEDEEDMLDFTASERKTSSRLSCQVKVREDMDGLEVELPPSQV